MTTMNVLDSGGGTVAVEKPLIPGQALMASSRPVVIASDQSPIPVASHAVTNAGTFAVQVSNANVNGLALPANAAPVVVAPQTTEVIVVPTVNVPLVAPVNAAFSTATTGGTLAAATYFYRVSATNAIGETLASTETSQVVPAGTATNTVTVNWGAVTGATGYKVYGRTTGAELLMATLGNVTTFVDTGSVTPAGALPASNTTLYVAGNVLGGIMTFANILPAVGVNGILESISVKFKAAAVTGEIDVAVFKASPAGTYTDKVAPTFNAADAALLLGIYALPTPLSTLGTMTCYNLDGIGKSFVGTTTSLFVVMTVKGTPTPASTADVSVSLSVLPG